MRCLNCDHAPHETKCLQKCFDHDNGDSWTCNCIRNTPVADCPSPPAEPKPLSDSMRPYQIPPEKADISYYRPPTTAPAESEGKPECVLCGDNEDYHGKNRDVGILCETFTPPTAQPAEDAKALEDARAFAKATHIDLEGRNWIVDSLATFAEQYAAKQIERQTPAIIEGIYVASRASVPERGEMWRRFRSDGYAITSSWIDEDGEGATDDFGNLWERITKEVTDADVVVLYAEQDDFPLKGAYIEVGIALGQGKPIIVCLPNVDLEPRSCRPIGSWISHPLVTRIDDINEAMQTVKARQSKGEK